MPELQDDNALRERILEESKSYVTLSPQEGEFTVQDFIEVYKEESMTYDRAKTALGKMVQDEKVYVRAGQKAGRSGKINIYGWLEKENK